MPLGPFFKDISGLPTWLHVLLGFFVLPTVIILVGRFSETLGMLLFGALAFCFLAYAFWETFWPKPK